MTRLCSLIVFCFISLSSVVAQEIEKPEENKALQDSLYMIQERHDKFLRPVKATFYSAIFPGLGQIYNKQYWKTPIIWAILYGSISSAINSHNKFELYRNAYKRRVSGFTDDVFFNINTPNPSSSKTKPDISTSTLASQQTALRQNRDLWVMLTCIVYILNVLEANVGAHLKEFDMNPKISFKPFISPAKYIDAPPNMGLSISFNL